MKTMLFEPVIAQIMACRTEVASRLEDDLAVLMRGGFPSDSLLAATPELDRWLTVTSPDIVQLAGVVRGHPIRRDGLIVTSPVCAIDCQTFMWARTTSRYYRLLRPLREIRFDG